MTQKHRGLAEVQIRICIQMRSGAEIHTTLTNREIEVFRGQLEEEAGLLDFFLDMEGLSCGPVFHKDIEFVRVHTNET